MKLIGKFLNICFLFIFFSSLLAVESDKTKFIGKDKEEILSITDYQLKKEQEEKQEELSKIELERRRLEEEKVRLKKEKANIEAKIQEEIEKEAKKQALLKEQEEQRRKIAELEEAKRNRISKVKIVNSNAKDNINLESEKGDFYMASYQEIGAAEDKAGSNVDRENILTTDMYIRALTETNVNSRRAGEFVVVVERNVYSLESKKVLLPKGSKILCKFQPLQKYGETAVIVECARVYFPNGKSLFMSQPQGNDQMGRSGLVGDLDNRNWEKYGQTFVLSLLSGGAIMLADKLPTDSATSLAQYTALSVVDLSTKILEKNVDLAPVVSIPSGSRMVLKPTTDINFNEEEVELND